VEFDAIDIIKKIIFIQKIEVKVKWRLMQTTVRFTAITLKI